MKSYCNIICISYILMLYNPLAALKNRPPFQLNAVFSIPLPKQRQKNGNDIKKRIDLHSREQPSYNPSFPVHMKPAATEATLINGCLGKGW